MPDSLRLAVFDVDGTLVDSQRNIVEANRRAFTAAGFAAPSAERIHSIIGLSLVEAIAVLLPDDAKHFAERVAEGYKKAYLELVASPDYHEPLFPGAVEALDRLEDEGWLLAIASSKSRKGIDRFIGRLGLEGRFLSIRTPDDGPGKPDPFMIESAMAELGAEREGTVMIGDTTYDIVMARNARVHGVGVDWGNHPGPALAQAGAGVVISRFEQLAGAMTRLLDGDTSAGSTSAGGKDHG